MHYFSQEEISELKRTEYNDIPDDDISEEKTVDMNFQTIQIVNFKRTIFSLFQIKNLYWGIAKKLFNRKTRADINDSVNWVSKLNF